MSKYTQILMQYETPLPDFHHGPGSEPGCERFTEIRRVPWPEFKLYGVNERSEAAVNEYSSIYLWSDLESMRGFLEGDLFDGYCGVFARPSVRSWLIHEATGDRSALTGARYCLRQIIPLPRQTPVGEFLRSWTDRESVAETLYRVVGFDPFQWQFIDLTVWRNRPGTPGCKSPVRARACVGTWHE
jgi:hypothetical protein